MNWIIYEFRGTTSELRWERAEHTLRIEPSLDISDEGHDETRNNEGDGDVEDI
jgi:hypothetical protein